MPGWPIGWPHVRRDAEVEEIRLGPLSRSEVVEQVTALTGEAPPSGLVAEVYARAEGHPFFTEQLVAAAVTDSGQRAQPVALPARLADLLVARAGCCGSDGQAVLAALAVAGRPLSEALLGEVTGLDPPTVRTAVRESDSGPAARGSGRWGASAPACAAGRGPGRRAAARRAGCVARTHRAVAAGRGNETLAAEAAGHWASAGRSDQELQARLTAARAAERVFAYADAATHWQRAIELRQGDPGADLGRGIDLPHLYIRAVDALEVSGDGVQAGAVAEEAYRRFADHPDRATAALMHSRAAYLRLLLDSSAPGLPLMKEGAAVRGHSALGRTRQGLVLVRGPLLGPLRGRVRRKSSPRSIVPSRLLRRPARRR